MHNGVRNTHQFYTYILCGPFLGTTCFAIYLFYLIICSSEDTKITLTNGMHSKERDMSHNLPSKKGYATLQLNGNWNILV